MECSLSPLVSRWSKAGVYRQFCFRRSLSSLVLHHVSQMFLQPKFSMSLPALSVPIEILRLKLAYFRRSERLLRLRRRVACYPVGARSRKGLTRSPANSIKIDFFIGNTERTSRETAWVSMVEGPLELTTRFRTDAESTTPEAILHLQNRVVRKRSVLKACKDLSGRPENGKAIFRNQCP
jgi:hypothetical protein